MVRGPIEIVPFLIIIIIIQAVWGTFSVCEAKKTKPLNLLTGENACVYD